MEFIGFVTFLKNSDEEETEKKKLTV